MKGLQLPLGVLLSDTASFDNYYAGPNAEATAALRGLLAADAAPRLLLFGPAASGKTHLLQSLVRSAALERLACAYVPLRQLAGEGIEVLAGLADTELVCLDDLDAVSGDADWCMGLVRFLDDLHTHGGRCALSAAAPAERLEVRLPDLATRLAQCTTYGLKPLSDDDRIRLLQEKARARGLHLPADVARFLMARLPRDAGTLVETLELLDRASLSAQRRLTLPFIQQWLRDAAPR